MQQIKNRYTGAVISEGNTVKEAAEKAESLSYANLSYADLCGADLRGADLRGADLFGANLIGANLIGARLWNTVGNMEEIKSLQIDTYAITYTADRLQIGCKNHAIREWWEFDDETIDAMDTGALDWWRVWMPILRQIIETSPATPTGKEA